MSVYVETEKLPIRNWHNVVLIWQEFINRGWRTYIWRRHVSCWSWTDVH